MKNSSGLQENLEEAASLFSVASLPFPLAVTGTELGLKEDRKDCSRRASKIVDKVLDFEALHAKTSGTSDVLKIS